MIRAKASDTVDDVAVMRPSERFTGWAHAIGGCGVLGVIGPFGTGRA